MRRALTYHFAPSWSSCMLIAIAFAMASSSLISSSSGTPVGSVELLPFEDDGSFMSTSSPVCCDNARAWARRASSSSASIVEWEAGTTSTGGADGGVGTDAEASEIEGSVALPAPIVTGGVEAEAACRARSSSRDIRNACGIELEYSKIVVLW